MSESPLSWPAVLLAAAAGAVAGWWPLHAWAVRNLKTRRAPLGGIRLAAAAVTAASFALIAWRLADDDHAAVLPAVLVFAAASTTLAIVDVREFRLPNPVILTLLGTLAVYLLLAASLTAEWRRLVWALIGATAMFAVYLLLALLSPGSMGMGDVKLAAPIGLLLGWFGLSTWTVGLLAAFVCGATASAIALALRRATLRARLPFGPSMMAGTLLAVLFAGGAG